MTGHDVMRASLFVREEAFARDLDLKRRMQIREAQGTDPARPGKVSWFGGLKATAQFLKDSVQEAVTQRRMTEANS